ncbi:MAG TPA: NAD(P)/FAD-dependent oxidoreductase [Gemmatimonadales bacterium]|nr:NAD(P)/FAD-dependent oxidoreductase [Gemmatimonadales bacterium]
MKTLMAPADGHQLDVLVAGAGPAGSATATLLARSGLSVLVVDRAAFPRDKACSEYMSPEAVRILARLGVLEKLEKAGGFPLEGMKVTGPLGATAHGKFSLAGYHPFRPTGLSISRRTLDHELLAAARAAGAAVMERARVEELLYEQGGVAGVVVRDQAGGRQALRARLTVGADGLRSVVARRLGRRRHGTSRRMAFVAHVARVADMGPSAELHFREHGYLGLNQIGQGQTNVALVVPSERAAHARGGVQRFFHDTLAEFPGVRERVEAGEVVRPVLATGPFAVRSARVIAPGALLVGDAADFFDPATGDGIYCALRGAELAADTAVAALSLPGPVTLDRLAEYRHRRRRLFTGKWMFERMIDSALRFPRLFDRGISRLGSHEEMAHTVIGLAGGFVPLRAVLNPVFLARMTL